MKTHHVTWSMVLVFALGFGVPGCFGKSENEGRICASPVDGDVVCVDSSDGPDAAWNEAVANGGTAPMEMWAVWRDDVELSELVSSPGLLNAWLTDVQVVMDYLRVTKGNAESYHKSLSGRMGDDIDRARLVQSEILFEKKSDPKGSVKRALLDKAALEIDPLHAEIASDKQAIGDVQVILEQTKVEGAPFASQYKSLVDDFVTYRAGEAAETLLYTLWSHEVSGAGIDELAAVEDGIVDTVHKASAKPNELLVAGMKLVADILQFETTARDTIAPHEDFINTQGGRMPDMTSSALRSIHAMVGYAGQRVARSDATAKTLLLGAGMRRRALQLLDNAPPTARATLAQTLLANASTVFAQSSQVQVKAMATTVKTSKLGLPYLAQRFDEHTTLLQMAPLCHATTSSWRENGCVALRPKMKDAATYLAQTLPAEIKQDLVVLKNHGVDPKAIDRVQQKLDAGDVKGAALAHDELLRSTEGT